MVKNKTGGKNTKKGARKNLNQENIVRKLRFVEDECECYGIVSKMLGNGQIEVLCADDKPRLGIIRNKFSGRNKSSNLIGPGSWVIIGLRSWETPKPNKLEKCDLLEIYTHQERSRLIQECKTNLSVLLKQERLSHNEEEEDDHGILFGYQEEEKEGGGGEDEEEELDDEINFDEI